MKGSFCCWVGGSLFLLLCVSCSSALTLDYFADVKIKVGKTLCTCSFTMVKNDDIVDVENAACNTKCKGTAKVTLGGPASSANIYGLAMKILKGSVTITKISANLVATKTTSSLPMRPKTTTRPVYPRLGAFYCDTHIKECLDGDSFPNIGQAFRGYNLILGDPLNFGGDPGFEGHIFDEAGERNGLVRFGNTAGNDLNRCDGSVRADYIETAEEFLESTMRSEDSKKWFQIGSEVELTGNLGYEGNLNLQIPYVEGVEAGGSSEYGIGATVTIPPLYQSVSSNSKVMTDISEGLESNQVSITRSSFSCHEYEFEITEFQHPIFTGQFKSAVQWLESCLMKGPPFNGETATNTTINGTSPLQDECAMKFFRNYGTHYLKAAKFGSRMSILTVLDSKAVFSANKEEVAKCATKSKSWSLLGIIGGGSSKDNCMEDLFQTVSGSAEAIRDEIIVTVGSRPKADYSEWAEQQGKPEIIHKTIAPISDLFTTNFMADIPLKFELNGVATIKTLLDKYLLYYCALFRSQCNYVVAKPFCPAAQCTTTTFDKCGHYTGPVDLNFLPHGEGTLTMEDEVSKMIWVHGCTANCAVQSYGALPGGYHLATEGEVVEHKEWILDTMDKWAIAKIVDGYIHGLGYGGQIITAQIEESNYKHMVVCKNEVIQSTTPAPTTPKPVTTYTFVNRKKKWIDAARYCASQGRRLAIIETMSELLKVQKLVANADEDVWLAGNDFGFEGHWKWAKGSPYEDWDEFINGGGSLGLGFNWEKGSAHVTDDEDCLFMNKDGEFDDQKCDKDRYSVCDDGTN